METLDCRKTSEKEAYTSKLMLCYKNSDFITLSNMQIYLVNLWKGRSSILKYPVTNKHIVMGNTFLSHLFMVTMTNITKLLEKEAPTKYKESLNYKTFV